MICRLCLIESTNYLPIFEVHQDTTALDSKIAQIITKYFYLDLRIDDDVSNVVCQECWRQLDDFHKFWLNIEEKQIALRLQLLSKPGNDAEVTNPLQIKVENVVLEYERSDQTQNQNAPPPREVEKLDLDNMLGEILSATKAEDAVALTLCEPEIYPSMLALPKMHEESMPVVMDLAEFTNSDSDDDDIDNDNYEPSSCASSTKSSEKDEINEKNEVGQSCEKDLGNEKDEANVNDEKNTSKPKGTRPRGRPSKDLSNNTSIVFTDNRIKRKYTKRAEKSSAKLKVHIKDRKRGRPRTDSSKKLHENSSVAKMSDPEKAEKMKSMREMDAYIAAHAKLSCAMCSQPIKDFMTLKRHFRSAHKCTGYVSCCGIRFIRRFLYVDHLKMHEDPHYFKCKHCDKVLGSRNSLLVHVLSAHANEKELQYPCSQCDKKFGKKYLLHMHIRASHRRQNAEPIHECDTCNRRYRTADDLLNHKRRVHLLEFAMMCDICGKNFKSKHNFLSHKEAIHGMGVQRPEMQCDICQRWLKDERSLKKHLYRHRDEESNETYKCDQCGQEKNSRSKLKSHIRYHHPKEFFKCTLCPKEFKRPRELEEHIATHTGQALYSCAYCSQTFKSHSNMHNHIKKVHPGKWIPKHTQPSSIVNAAAAIKPEEDMALHIRHINTADLY